MKRSRGGFTLLETAISTLLVGLVVVVSMRTVGSVFRMRSMSSDAAAARLLADQLLWEILEKPYREPHVTPVFGPESGETGRSLYDDVDDFNSYSETPPRFRDGVSMNELSGWTRSVTVQEVATSDPLLSAGMTVGGTPVGIGLRSGGPSGSGVRRITVAVQRNNTLLATAAGVKSGSAK